MDDVHFEITSKLGKRIRVTKSRWDLIVKTKHPEIEGHESDVKQTLADPDEIRLSRSDSSVYLYYKKRGRLWLAVVAKHRNGDGSVITAYFTDRIKEGDRVYQGQK